MATDVGAELLGFFGSIAFAIPAVRLLGLQRRISKTEAFAEGGKSKNVRELAGELRDQYKKGFFGFSAFDALCVAAGVLLLVVSTVMKIA